MYIICYFCKMKHCKAMLEMNEIDYLLKGRKIPMEMILLRTPFLHTLVLTLESRNCFTTYSKI